MKPQLYERPTRRRVLPTLAALFAVVLFPALPAGATYSAGTEMTAVSITTPSVSGKKWLADSSHSLECSTSTDSDCNLTTCQPESDSLTHYWTADAGTFSGNDNVGTQVTYLAPSTYQTSNVTITAHADDDYAPESNYALYDEAEKTDSCTVVIMQIAKLTDTITEDEYDEVAVPSSGETSVGYYDASYGNLRKVEIVRSNVDYDYDIGEEITADLDEDTGNIDVTLSCPGAYLVRTTRSGGDKIYDYLFETAAGKQGDKKTGKTKTITFPAQDLIVISSSTSDNDFLVNARSSISGEVAVGSIANVITAINNKWNNNGNQPFTLGIIDHGGEFTGQGVGGGTVVADGKQLDLTQGRKQDLDAFTAACKGKVTAVTLYGCNVALYQNGNLLQTIATDGNITVTGHEGSVYCDYRAWGLWNHWEASADGNTVTKSPQ